MPRKENHLESNPKPAAADQADSFSTPVVGDAFEPLTPEREVSIWADIRSLLQKFITAPAGPDDREKCNQLLIRLGLDVSLGPLLLVATREGSDLERVVLAGRGQAEKAAALQRELRCYVDLAASSPEQNKKNAQERERLGTEFTAATRLGQAAAKAASELCHLESWLPELFGREDWSKERDDMGRLKTGGGRLASTICPTKTQQAASTMGINPYLVDSWRIQRPEPTPPKRRYRTSASSPAPPLGQLPYSRF